MTAAPDPVTLSIVWKNLIATAEEMGAVLKRTAFSPALREARDFSASLHDADGQLVAHGRFTPGHTGAAIRGLPLLLDRIDVSALRPGDALLYNDLELSLGHLPDVFSVLPLFIGEQIVGYSVTSAHHVDVGGPAPGSISIEGVRDVYAEGLRLPPVRHFVAGEPNPDVFNLIKANSRMPDRVEGDLYAQIAANRRGAELFHALVQRYGLDTVTEASQEILLHAERVMRRAIADVPDGRYEFEDRMDDHGPGTGPLTVAAAVEVSRDELVVDFAGTSPQVGTGINAYFGFTLAYTLFAIKAVLDPDGPANAGSLRPIRVVAPRGCFLNPVHPAPGGGRAVVLTRIVDVVIGALAGAAPERVPAAPSQFMNSAFGGRAVSGDEQFVYFELLFGGTGARPDGDGSEAVCSALDVDNIPAEVYEATSPMRVERFEVIPDSGGPGRYRGGCGVRKDIRVLADSIVLTNMGDRTETPPYGLAGGRPGRVGHSLLESASGTRKLESKGTYVANRGDLVSLRLSGGGGYRDPLDRDAELVAADVREGYVTEAGARNDYGVCLVPGTMAPDPEATRRARDQARTTNRREAI
jgi:N-methylhydantoinase B